MQRSSSVQPSPRAQSPRGIVTVDNNLPANFERRTTLPWERQRARIIAAIENIGARSAELDRLLRSDKHLTAGLALRVASLQKQSIDQTKLRSLKSIVYECKGLVKSAESAGSGGVSSAALTLKCRELDAARRIWAGLAHEEQQWSMVKQRLRRYEDVVTTKELRDAMQAITI